MTGSTKSVSVRVVEITERFRFTVLINKVQLNRFTMTEGIEVKVLVVQWTSLMIPFRPVHLVRQMVVSIVTGA